MFSSRLQQDVVAALPVLKHCELARHGESGLSGAPRAARRTPQLLSDEKQKRLILARTIDATLHSKRRSIEPPHFYGSVRSTCLIETEGHEATAGALHPRLRYCLCAGLRMHSRDRQSHHRNRRCIAAAIEESRS
jgi:hypothetical protein